VYDVYDYCELSANMVRDTTREEKGRDEYISLEEKKKEPSPKEGGKNKTSPFSKYQIKCTQLKLFFLNDKKS